MPNPTVALIGAGSTLIGGMAQSSAARSAAGSQERAALAGIEEQRRQFDEMRKILQPYVTAGGAAIGGMQPFVAGGQEAFEQQQALAGLRGPEAQQAAISQVEQSPFLQAQIEQGERAMLQRAGATGGLRGGNLQAALSQFRPQMLQQAIEQQYGRLGGISAAGLGTLGQLSQLGQASAARTGAAATGLGESVSGLMQQQGAAQAGARLAGAAPFVALSQIPGQMAGYQMATGQNVFGGNPFQAAFSQTMPGSSGFGTGLAYGNQDIGQFL